MVVKEKPLKVRKFFVIFLLLILTISYFSEALFLKGILSFRDLGRYFYPLRLFTVNMMKSGIVPLWNPYISCGVPHLALQQSVIFYPLSIIYYILPFDLAFNVFLVAHIFLAGLFVYLLCLRWGFRQSSSVISAVIFMFSGYMISVINLATTLSSVIWFPLILLFFDKALADGSAVNMFLSAVFLAVMFLGGEPSIFYSTLWVLFFYAIFFFLYSHNNKNPKKIFTIFLIVAIISVLLSAIQLLPFLELTRWADRTSGTPPFEQVTHWSLHLRDIFSFVMPFFARTDFSKESYWQEQNWVILIYLGALSLILIPLCIFLNKDWRIKFLYFVGVLFLLVSCGNNTPIYYLIYKFIPGLKFIRYPTRFLYITTFAVAMICGAGFNAYLLAWKKGDARLGKFLKIALFVAYIIAILFLGLNLYNKNFLNMGLKFCSEHIDSKKNAFVFLTYAADLINLKRFFGFIMAGILILFLGFKSKLLRKKVVAFSFVSLVIVDFFSVMPTMMLMLDYGTLHETMPNIAYLKQDKSLFRFFTSPKTKDSDIFLTGGSYRKMVQLAKDRFSPDWPVMYGLYDAHGYDSIWIANYLKFIHLVETSNSPSDTAILNLLNVKYVVTLDDLKVSGYELLNKREVCLYENKNVLPRAFLVSSYNVLKKEEDIANRLQSKDFDPAKEVILEEEPVAKEQACFALPTGRQAAGRGAGDKGHGKEKVEITKYSPNEVIIRTITNSPKFLILSDTYYPGWKVYVDGRRDKIYKADFILRAVYLEEGSHTVRFLFDPFSFKLGVIISITTLLGVIGTIVFRKNI